MTRVGFGLPVTGEGAVVHEEQPEKFNGPRIVDASGRAVVRGGACPRCGAGRDRRIKASGFTGAMCCGKCGYDYPEAEQ